LLNEAERVTTQLKQTRRAAGWIRDQHRILTKLLNTTLYAASQMSDEFTACVSPARISSEARNKW